jgi:pimeloyl-ACP methyl ester carboxylesterase
MKSKQLYIFSGLGADERVFQKQDFSGFSASFVSWITPLKNESIEDYSTRLLAQIKSEKPILIGLSFGGMIATEVAKQIDTEQVILIASAKNKSEIPFYYRLAGKLKFHKLIPASFLKKSNFILYWLFGTKSTFDRQLLKQILSDSDPIFVKWAIDKVVNWQNETKIRNTTHIHGTADKVLPYRFVKCDVTVQNGGHLMTLNREEELSQLIRKVIG